MKNNYELSIIIPVYNIEKLLKRCLDSIYNQKEIALNFEVITVNDGSPDNSVAIQEEYAEHYTNFKMIVTKNGGAGSARNRGLEVATGKYIWFVDGDDFTEEGSLKFIYEKAILQDESIGFNFYYYSSAKGRRPARPCLDDEPYSKVYFGLNYMNGKHISYLWNVILKRQLIEDNNIRFIEGVKNIEDFEFAVKYYSLNDKITFYNERLYNYYENEHSTSRSRSRQNLEKMASDSHTVHKSLYENENRAVYNLWLTKSIIGFFVSLIKYYTREDFDHYIRVYRQEKLLPITITKELNNKYKMFGLLLNYNPSTLYNICKWMKI